MRDPSSLLLAPAVHPGGTAWPAAPSSSQKARSLHTQYKAISREAFRICLGGTEVRPTRAYMGFDRLAGAAPRLPYRLPHGSAATDGSGVPIPRVHDGQYAALGGRPRMGVPPLPGRHTLTGRVFQQPATRSHTGRGLRWPSIVSAESVITESSLWQVPRWSV